MMVVSARRNIHMFRIRSTVDHMRYLLANGEFGKATHGSPAIEFFDVHNACDIADYARVRESVEVVTFDSNKKYYVPLDS